MVQLVKQYRKQMRSKKKGYKRDIKASNDYRKNNPRAKNSMNFCIIYHKN